MTPAEKIECPACGTLMVHKFDPDVYFWCSKCRKTRFVLEQLPCGCDLKKAYDHDQVQCLADKLDRQRAKTEEVGKLYVDARSSLRNRFAAAAIAGAMGQFFPETAVAEKAYKVADAMLAIWAKEEQ